MALTPAERIQNRIWGGYRKAAAKLGRPKEVFRPTDPMNPLRLIDLVGTYPIAVDASPDFKFNGPARPGVALHYALVDGAEVQAGDYFVGDEYVFFLGEMAPLQSIMAVRCNVVVTLMRSIDMSDFGSTEPPGTMQDVALFANWPASILRRGRGPGDDVPLPGDVNPSEYECLLPVVYGVDPPRSGDVLVDEHERRFAVDAFNPVSTGWSLSVRLLAAA